MILLKPLDQALKDNDPIRAVIAGSGINQDGKTVSHTSCEELQLYIVTNISSAWYHYA